MESTPHTFYRILRLKQLVGVALDNALESSVLTTHQYTILSMVRRWAPVTSAELARLLQISAQSMGESLKSLEDKGYISRSTSPANKRMILFVVTPEGKRAATKADRLVARAEEVFFACLSPRELADFEKAVATVRAHHEPALGTSSLPARNGER